MNRNKLAAALLLCVLLQATIFLLVFRLGDIPPAGDAGEYHVLARNLLEHGALSLNLSPPYVPTVKRTAAYPLLLAAIYSVTGPSPLAVGMAQFAIFAISCWLLFLLCERFMSVRAAACAALLFACYLPNGLYCVMIMNETVATCLVVAFMLAPGSQPPRAWQAGVLGLLAGLCTLLHPTLAVLLVIAVPTLMRSPRPWRTAVCAAAGFSMCVVPWLVRNYVVAERPLLIVTGSGLSLYQSALQYSGELVIHDEGHHARTLIDDADRYRALRAQVSPTSRVPPLVQLSLMVDKSYLEEGKRRFAALSPWQIVRALPTRLIGLWETCNGTYLWSALPPSGWIPPLQVAYMSLALRHVEQYQHAAIALGVVAGLWLSRKRLREQWPLWLLPLYVTLVHCVLHVECRYTVPAQIFLFPYAGHALVGLLEALGW